MKLVRIQVFVAAGFPLLDGECIAQRLRVTSRICHGDLDRTSRQSGNNYLKRVGIDECWAGRNAIRGYRCRRLEAASRDRDSCADRPRWRTHAASTHTSALALLRPVPRVRVPSSPPRSRNWRELLHPNPANFPWSHFWPIN